MTPINRDEFLHAPSLVENDLTINVSALNLPLFPASVKEMNGTGIERGEASKQERLAAAFLKLDRFLDSLRDLQEIRGECDDEGEGFANLAQTHGEIRSIREFSANLY